MNKRHFHRQGPFVPPMFGDLPVGSVIAFAGDIGCGCGSGNATPTIEAWGWMVCDGRSLRSQRYPELFVALGHLYGGKDGDFKIPDYRGYFLRGVDGGSGNDPDIDTRTAPPGGTGTKAAAGSIQRDALLSHVHDYDTAPAPSAPSGNGNAAALGGMRAATTTPEDPMTRRVLDADSGASAHETRPRNIYVNYLIKFGCAQQRDNCGMF